MPSLSFVPFIVCISFPLCTVAAAVVCFVNQRSDHGWSRKEMDTPMTGGFDCFPRRQYGGLSGRVAWVARVDRTTRAVVLIGISD